MSRRRLALDSNTVQRVDERDETGVEEGQLQFHAASQQRHDLLDSGRADRRVSTPAPPVFESSL